jgi:hypothetical protein
MSSSRPTASLSTNAVAPDLLQPEAALAEQAGQGREIGERDKRIKILVRPSLPTKQRIDAPPAINPELNAMVPEHGVEFSHIFRLHCHPLLHRLPVFPGSAQRVSAEV